MAMMRKKAMHKTEEGQTRNIETEHIIPHLNFEVRYYIFYFFLKKKIYVSIWGVALT